ncbi:hypothetical protein BGX38DRAFT_652794 [Terfezia claveryi]|nr:hypothetical protein BGX38DRAFT_652794 [Terfezia claveryi]
MPEYHQQSHRPSTYTATITTDQIIISRPEYNELVENKFRLSQANDTVVSLKSEIEMLKNVVQRLVGFYGTTGNGTNTTGNGMIGSSTGHQKDDNKDRIRAKKLTARRDSGVDGVSNHENDEEIDPHPSHRAPMSPVRENGITLPVTQSFAIQKHTDQNELNLLDLYEDEKPVPARQTKTTIMRNGTYDSTDDQAEIKPQTYSRIAAARRPLESPVAPPPSPPPAPHVVRKVYREREPEPQPQPQLGYESPEEEEERTSTPASWERAPAAPEVTFDDFNADDDSWRRSTEWDPAPGKGKEKAEVAVVESSRPAPTLEARPTTFETRPTTFETRPTTFETRPTTLETRPIIQAVKSDWRSPTIVPNVRTKMEDSSPSPPTSIISSGSKTARQLFLEKKSLQRALAEAHSEQLAASSAGSSTGDIDKISDPSTFRHIYIPNLPANATLSTLSSIIRTNGQGGVEFISLFRQKAEGLDLPNFEDPGSGENIGVNITFTTAEACDAWFKFLFENSSQKLQGNPTKTWLFPNEDSAAEWKKCAVFRRSDYHPSIAGKIDKGGPGGQATMAEAQKRGATRVIQVNGLPPDVTESDLAWLSLPPGNRSLLYDGVTQEASGQAGLSTEEFARWKWLEKIVIEDEEPAGFGDGGERRKTARIYAAGVKTAYLARGKIWKKYNRNGAVIGKTSGGYVKVEFIKDECEGPLEELPPWVVVGGDDDDLDFGDGEGGGMDE